MNLDLSKFKKVETNDKCTTLAHPSGHKIKISHKSLSPDFQKQIADMPTAFAKGGKVSKPSKSSNKMPGSPTEAKNSFTEPDAMGTSMPKGMLQKEMNDKVYPDVVVKSLNREAPPFGPLGSEPEQHYPPCINPSCKSYGHSHPNCRCYGGVPEAGYFAEGGEVDDEYYCDKDRPHFSKCEYFANGGMTDDPLEPVPQEQPEPQQEMAQAPEINPNPEAQATQPVDEEAPVEQQPPPQPQVQRAPASPVQQFQERKAADLGGLHQEAQAFQNDLNAGHIKPETYHSLFAKKDTLGKIGTLFGLMISGAGSGLTHQPNSVMQMMNNEINNDLEAQKQSVGNEQNYLKINQQGLMNQANVKDVNVNAATKAAALAKVQMNYAALHKLVQDTLKLPPGSPQRMQAEQTLAMLNQGVQNENFNVLDRAATAGALGSMLSGSGGGGTNTTLLKSGLMGPEAREVGGDIEQKTIPGVGRGSIPIPQQVRDQVQAMKVLSDKASDLMKYAKGNIATLSPAKRAIAKQKAEEMVNFYNSSIQGGVLTEGRLKWLDDQIKKNPTGVITQLMGNNSRLMEIKNSNDHRMNLMLKNYGVNPSKQTGDQHPDEGKVFVNKKTGARGTIKNGKWTAL